MNVTVHYITAKSLILAYTLLRFDCFSLRHEARCYIVYRHYRRRINLLCIVKQYSYSGITLYVAACKVLASKFNDGRGRLSLYKVPVINCEGVKI